MNTSANNTALEETSLLESFATQRNGKMTSLASAAGPENEGPYETEDDEDDASDDGESGIEDDNEIDPTIGDDDLTEDNDEDLDDDDDDLDENEL